MAMGNIYAYIDTMATAHLPEDRKCHNGDEKANDGEATPNVGQPL